MSEIVAAAIKFKPKGENEFRYRLSSRHHICFQNMQNSGIEYDKNSCEQGFWTNDGKFLNREDAAKLAYKNGQIKEEKKELFSEDLW